MTHENTPEHLLKDPEFVTDRLNICTCPRCGCDGVLVNGERTLVVCQTCAFRCVRLSHTLFVGETPGVSQPILTLKDWAVRALSAFGMTVERHDVLRHISSGRWVGHWRMHWTPEKSALSHRILKIRYDAEFKDSIRINWPEGLNLGLTIQDAPMWRNYVREE